MFKWTEVKCLESESAYENHRAEFMCCSVSYTTYSHDKCTVCAGDHVMIERRVRCKSPTCSVDHPCRVVWKVFHCTVYDRWVVMVNDESHGRMTRECGADHKAIVTKDIKAYIKEQDEGDGATPRLLETRMKKTASLAVPARGWPTAEQIANALKRIREALGSRNTIESIDAYVEAHALTVDTHKTPKKAFVFGPTLNGAGRPHVGTGTNVDPFLLGTTSFEKLETAIRHAQVGRFTMFHADATFKLSDCAYPVITCGFTDSARAYQLVALFVVSQRTTRDFKLCFQALSNLTVQLFGDALDVDAFMGDADDAQVSGLHGVPAFAKATPLMCFFHVLYNVRKKTTHFSPYLRMMIMTSIMDMHYCLSLEEFVHVRDQELARWRQYGELTVFCEYFGRQWLSGRFWRWQIFHSPPGFAATNNPCEVYNSTIKSYTRRRRYHMTKLLGTLGDLVESHKSVEPVDDDFAPEPTRDVADAALKMVESGRTTVDQVPGTTTVRVLYRQASAMEDDTNSETAFVATFDTGCDIGKKVGASNNTTAIVEAEKTKAAAMHRRACSWSLWRAHKIGMPADGWLVDYALRTCGCRYFHKFIICAHLLIAEYREDLKSIGKKRKLFDRSRNQAPSNSQKGKKSRSAQQGTSQNTSYFAPWHQPSSHFPPSVPGPSVIPTWLVATPCPPLAPPESTFAPAPQDAHNSPAPAQPIEYLRFQQQNNPALTLPELHPQYQQYRHDREYTHHQQYTHQQQQQHNRQQYIHQQQHIQQQHQLQHQHELQLQQQQQLQHNQHQLQHNQQQRQLQQSQLEHQQSHQNNQLQHQHQQSHEPQHWGESAVAMSPAASLMSTPPPHAPVAPQPEYWSPVSTASPRHHDGTATSIEEQWPWASVYPARSRHQRPGGPVPVVLQPANGPRLGRPPLASRALSRDF